MTKLELVEKAIDFAMSGLCDRYLDISCGCEGCPLWDEDDMNDDGNVDCRGKMLKEFVKQHEKEFELDVTVRHGYWIENHSQTYIPVEYDYNGNLIPHDYVTYQCSLCNKIASKKYAYCHCGAIMDTEV